MKLIPKWEVFSQQIDDFAANANGILQKESLIKEESELEQVKIEIKEWNTFSYKYLKESFDEENNELAIGFYNAKPDRYMIGNFKKDFRQTKKEVFEDFKEKLKTLIYYKRILSISDAIIKPDIINIADRSSFTTEEILDLILEKLYDLYDDFYHSLLTILEGNGIKLKRHREESELAQLLENNGYINLVHTKDTSAQLTTLGKMYVEEKRKTYQEKYDDINETQEEINKKVDEIIEHLTKLGLGQEIIFNEIQELKELYPKLNKKSWGQIVKGKLIDLALAKLIEKDTLNYIYHALTNHTMRLP